MSPAKLRAQCTGIAEAARRRCLSMAEQYGLNGLPANIERRIQEARLATTTATAQGQADRVVDAMDIACLAAWARGEISGPNSPESLERRAKQAESLAKMFDTKEDRAAAKKQRARAKQFRQQAETLRKEKPDVL